MEVRNQNTKRSRTKSKARPMCQYRQCFPELVIAGNFKAWVPGCMLNKHNDPFFNTELYYQVERHRYGLAYRQVYGILGHKDCYTDSDSEQSDEETSASGDGESEIESQQSKKRRVESEDEQLDSKQLHEKTSESTSQDGVKFDSEETHHSDSEKSPTDAEQEANDPEQDTNQAKPEMNDLKVKASSSTGDEIEADGFVVISADTSEHSSEKSVEDDSTSESTDLEVEANTSADDFVVISADTSEHSSEKLVEDDPPPKSSCTIF